MQATIIRKFEAASIPSEPTVFSGENCGAIMPLLDLALTETHAQGAYLYHFDRGDSTARLVVWSGLSPIAAAVPLEVQGITVRSHIARNAPIVLQDDAWQHPAFSALPEFRKNRFEGVVSVPLLEAGRGVGMLDVCRSHRAGLQPREFSFLLSLSVPVGALLAASAARLNLELEVQKLTRQLADRKLLDRAKGVIQSRLEWSEEQAYFCLRNLSRRRRISMRLIAEEVIATGASGIFGEEAHDEE